MSFMTDDSDVTNSASRLHIPRMRNFGYQDGLHFAYNSQPLRYAIFALDPRSKHPPTPTFNILRALPGLTIIERTDSDFVTWDKPMPANASQHLRRERRLLRQGRFFEKLIDALV